MMVNNNLGRMNQQHTVNKLQKQSVSNNPQARPKSPVTGGRQDAYNPAPKKNLTVIYAVAGTVVFLLLVFFFINSGSQEDAKPKKHQPEKIKKEREPIKEEHVTKREFNEEEKKPIHTRPR